MQVGSELKGDMEYLLSFVPATDPSDVEPGLPAMCYITGTYDGDVAVIQRVADIKAKYNLAEQ